MIINRDNSALIKAIREGRRKRKEAKAMEALGYENVGDYSKLWELHRGYRQKHRITDVKISDNGKSLWVKTEEDKSK